MSTLPGIGVEFAGYSIERLLGRGGGGLVYLAKDLRLSRHVALKILSAELAEDPRFRERFVRESRLAASIDHHNIIPIFAADEVDGVLYIAMRYVAGTDLRKLLAEERTLDADRAVSIVAQVADALDVAHAQGLVHRDVKPGNVLIVPRLSPSALDHAYLADFGITKHVTTDHSLTGAGQFVGTTDYVAPEQIMGGAIDGRADIYSLACVFYECLAGVAPFERDSDVAVIYAHLSDQRPLLSVRRPELPPEFDVVMSKAMAKSPDDRYPTAGAFAAAARAALRDGDRGATTAIGSRGTPPTPSSRPADAAVAASPADSGGSTLVTPPAEPATQTAFQTPPASAPAPAYAPAPGYPPVSAPVAPRPSRRIAVIAVVLLVAAVGAVLAVVLAQRHTSTPGATTASGVQAMLLTAADFPTGAVSPLATTLRLAEIRCGAAPTAEVEEHNVAFEDKAASSGHGYFYYQATASFNSVTHASDYIDQVGIAARNCTAQLSPARAAPQLATRSVRVTFPSGDGQITYDAVYLWAGRFVSVVMVSALGTTPPPASYVGTYASLAATRMVNDDPYHGG